MRTSHPPLRTKVTHFQAHLTTPLGYWKVLTVVLNSPYQLRIQWVSQRIQYHLRPTRPAILFPLYPQFDRIVAWVSLFLLEVVRIDAPLLHLLLPQPPLPHQLIVLTLFGSLERFLTTGDLPVGRPKIRPKIFYDAGKHFRKIIRILMSWQN